MGWLDRLFALFGSDADDDADESATGIHDPQYRQDHLIPLRRWAHGALAIEVGSGADPALYGAENVRWLTDSWGCPDRDALLAKMIIYVNGETTLAFDKVRIIRLARHGFGAQWLTEDECWNEWILPAVRATQPQYSDWEHVVADCEKGRLMWWKHVAGKDVPDHDTQRYQTNYAFAREHVFPFSPFKDAL